VLYLAKPLIPLHNSPIENKSADINPNSDVSYDSVGLISTAAPQVILTDWSYFEVSRISCTLQSNDWGAWSEQLEKVLS
jgi:hypothetical protein